MSRYRVGGRFVLRIPLLPYDLLDAGSGDISDQRCRLSAIVDRPEVAEAIYLASRTLHGNVETWRSAPDSDTGYKSEMSLAKYVAQMASSPIPFGAFAGVATGEIDKGVGDQGSFTLEGPARHRRTTRVDGAVLCRLMAELAQAPALRRRLVFRTNTSASVAAGILCYVQAGIRSDRRLADEYALMSVELTPYLRWVIEEARSGATLDALASALLRQVPDVTLAEAEAYVEQLVDTQILVPELGVWATGIEPMEGVARQLADAGLDDMARSFERIRVELRGLDAAGVGRPVASYSAVVELVRQLWRTARAMVTVDVPGDLEAERLFHLDLTVAAMARPTLAAEVIRDVERTVDLLRQIAPRREDPALLEFRDAFVERWGDREVPLMEALEEGLGLGSRLMGVSPPADDWSSREQELSRSKVEDQPGAARDRRTVWLLKMWQRACVEGVREVVVSPEELAALAHEFQGQREARLPAAFAVTVRLGLSREGRQLWLQRVTGPSGVRSLGRLCHADPDIESMVREHLAGEAAACSGAVLAEIVHLTDARSADALCRPVLRDHEIVYLGRGSAPPECQIDVGDLTLTVRDGRVLVRSQRLGREVVPRLTSAHRLSRSPFAVCRLLAALQAQDSDRVGWSWGPLEKFSWLPRVRIGDVVVARQQWRLSDDDAMCLGQSLAEKDLVCRRRRVFDVVEAVRARRSLPRHVILVEEEADGDNGEFVDLEHHLLVHVLAGEVVIRDRRLLAEVYPEPSASIVRGPEGHHASELILTFVREPDGTCKNVEP